MVEISKSVLQAGQAVDITRQIERVLNELGAQGRGLHEKANSIEALLPAPMMKRFRYVASVRNALSHHDKVFSDTEFENFLAAGRQLLQDLERVKQDVQRRRLARQEIARNVGRQAGVNLGRIAAIATVVGAGIVYVFVLPQVGDELREHYPDNVRSNAAQPVVERLGAQTADSIAAPTTQVPSATPVLARQPAPQPSARTAPVTQQQPTKASGSHVAALPPVQPPIVPVSNSVPGLSINEVRSLTRGLD